MVKCTKDQHPDVSLTWRAHKPEETGAPRKMHLRIQARAHLSATQRRIDLGKVHQVSAEPLVRPNLA